jgi:hypothetical protein
MNRHFLAQTKKSGKSEALSVARLPQPQGAEFGLPRPSMLGHFTLLTFDR